MQNTPDETVVGKWPDPISFLTDYRDFALNIRPLIIKLIADRHEKSGNTDEKKLLHQFALERFFFLWETSLAFYCAALHKGPLDLYRWLNEKFRVLNEKSKILAEQNFHDIFRSEYPDLEDGEIDDIVSHVIEITKLMKRLAAPTKALMPIFNRMKHKCLICKLGDEVSVLLSGEAERELGGIMEGIQIEERSWAQDLSWLGKLVESTRKVISFDIEIIIARIEKSDCNRWLSGPGVNAPLFDLTEYNRA